MPDSAQEVFVANFERQIAVYLRNVTFRADSLWVRVVGSRARIRRKLSELFQR